MRLRTGQSLQSFPGIPSIRPPDGSEGDYTPNDDDGLPDDPDPVPTPTGREGRYHTYLLTVAPNVAKATFVEIRVKAFQDLVEPPKTWTPPSNHALIVERHLLRVAVASGAVEDIFADIDPDDTVAAVKAETKLANEVYLPEKLVIPAGENGYLVLAVGTAAQHGIQGSTAKLVDKAKLSAALQLYNIKSEFALPYPGNDLAVFLRNGGTIELYHRDIAANTAKGKKQMIMAIRLQHTSRRG